MLYKKPPKLYREEIKGGILEQESLWDDLVEIECLIVFKILRVKVYVEGALGGYMICFCEILLLIFSCCSSRIIAG